MAAALLAVGAAILLIHEPAALAGAGKDLKLAQGAVRHARELVRKASADCETALALNLEMSDGTISSLRRSATVKSIEDHRLFVAGMALGAALAKCPKGVIADLNKVSHFLGTAKTRLGEDDDEEDRPRKRKSRRSSGGWRGDLDGALQALEEVDEDLEDEGGKCRRGIGSNLRSAKRQIKKILRRPSAGKLRDTRNFMLGLNLAGPLAKCSADVNDGLGEAYRLIHRADKRLGGGSSGKDPARYIKKAARDIGDARDALDEARRTCREGLRANLKRAARDLDDLSDEPNPRDVKDAHAFVGGLVLAAGLGKCPSEILDSLGHALKMLQRARKAF